MPEHQVSFQVSHFQHHVPIKNLPEDNLEHLTFLSMMLNCFVFMYDHIRAFWLSFSCLYTMVLEKKAGLCGMLVVSQHKCLDRRQVTR